MDSQENNLVELISSDDIINNLPSSSMIFSNINIVNDINDLDDINLDELSNIDNSEVQRIISDLNNDSLPVDILESVIELHRENALNYIDGCGNIRHENNSPEIVLNESIENILNLNDENEIEQVIADETIENYLRELLERDAEEIRTRNQNNPNNAQIIDLSSLPLTEEQRDIIRNFEHLKPRNYSIIANWRQGIVEKGKWILKLHNIDSPQTLINGFIEIGIFIRTGMIIVKKKV